MLHFSWILLEALDRAITPDKENWLRAFFLHPLHQRVPRFPAHTGCYPQRSRHAVSEDGVVNEILKGWDFFGVFILISDKEDMGGIDVVDHPFHRQREGRGAVAIADTVNKGLGASTAGHGN